MARRRRINQIIDPVLSVEVAATKVSQLVYLLVSNKPFKIGKNYSRIIYIGTTGLGVGRIAESASTRIVQAIDDKSVPGIRRVDAYVVWAKPRKGPQTAKGRKLWHVLERALLLRFFFQYGTPPPLNGTGHKMKERSEFEVFTRTTIDRVINRYT